MEERTLASVVGVDHAGTPLGLVTERELVRALSRHGAAALELQTGQVMLSPPLFCTPDDTVGDVLRLMTDNRSRHVLVLEGGAMARTVSIGALGQTRADDAE